MRIWTRVPLRVRVASAFAVVSALGLAALGVFLHVQVAGTLDAQVESALSTRLDALVRLGGEDRDAAVRDTSGDAVAQVLGSGGEVRATSPGIDGPVLAAEDLPGPGERRWLETSLLLPSEDERAPVRILATGTGTGVLVVGTSTEDVDEVLEGLRAQLVTGGLLVLLVASVLGYLVAGVGLRPMEDMRRHAERISAGSSAERLPLPPVRDEVHRLGRTLNAMLDRLDEGLRQQRQFVAEAGHELRTPLALLRTELDLAASRSRSPEELADFVASATEEVERLADLVDRLLTLASADDTRLELDLETVDVRHLLEQVAGRYTPMAAPRAVTVEPGGPVSVTGDRRRLDQVVSNLVENAVRHGRGDVRLAVEGGGDGAVVRVVDEGRVELGEEVWGRFRRGEGARSGGRGLGLSLVRAIVTEHGGQAWVDHGAPTTTVCIRLPA